MNLENKEKLKLSTPLIVIAVLLFLTVLAIFLTPKSELKALKSEIDKKTIGKIKYRKSEALRRESNRLLWLPAQVNEEVYPGTQFKTGSSSEIILLNPLGLEVRLDPFSQAKIGGQSKEWVIEVLQGRVWIKSAKKTSWSMKWKGDVISVDFDSPETELSITNNSRSLQTVYQTQGRSQFNWGNTLRKLGANEFIFVDKEKQLPVGFYEVTLEAPEYGKGKWATSDELVSFQWRRLKTEKIYRLQVSPNPTFRFNIVDEVVPSNQYKTRELTGDRYYYWRLVDEKTKRISSPVGVFALIDKSAPKPVFPISRLNFQKEQKWGEDKELFVTFRWEDKFAINNYRLQVSKDLKFTKLVYNQETNQPYVHQLSLPSGQYYWRVKAEGVSPIAALWSDPVSFGVEAMPNDLQLVEGATEKEESKEEEGLEKAIADGGDFDQKVEIEETMEVVAENENDPSSIEQQVNSTESVVAVPGLARKKVVTVLNFDSDGEDRELASVEPKITNAPNLSWNEVEEATEYTIQISKDAKFKKLLVNENIEETDFKWNEPIPGRFYWRVRSVNEDKKKSPFSPPAKLVVGLPKPILKESYTFETKVKSPDLLTQPGEPIKVEWSKVPKSKGYKFQLSRDPAFKEIVTSKTVDDESIEVNIPENGDYYTRVAALSYAKRQISHFSRPAKVKYSRILDLMPPGISFPANGLTQIIPAKDQFQPILFKWDKVKHAKIYKLQISGSPEFKEVFVEKSISENEFSLTEMPPNETSFWRIRSEHLGSFSEWSIPRQFQIKTNP